MSVEADFADALTKAQSAPADNYVLWAEVPQDGRAVPVILETIALPQSLSAAVIEDRVRGTARATLKSIGFEDAEIAEANFFLNLVPDVKAEVDRLADQRHLDDDLVLLEYIPWETFKRQTGLSPKIVEGQEEIKYRGFRIQRSGAA